MKNTKKGRTQNDKVNKRKKSKTWLLIGGVLIIIVAVALFLVLKPATTGQAFFATEDITQSSIGTKHVYIQTAKGLAAPGDEVRVPIYLQDIAGDTEVGVNQFQICINYPTSLTLKSATPKNKFAFGKGASVAFPKLQKSSGGVGECSGFSAAVDISRPASENPFKGAGAEVLELKFTAGGYINDEPSQIVKLKVPSLEGIHVVNNVETKYTQSEIQDYATKYQETQFSLTIVEKCPDEDNDGWPKKGMTQKNGATSDDWNKGEGDLRACAKKAEYNPTTKYDCVDVATDCDSLTGVANCKKLNANTINPSGTDNQCDGVDQNCNGNVDDGFSSTTINGYPKGQSSGKLQGVCLGYQSCSNGVPVNSFDTKDSLFTGYDAQGKIIPEIATGDICDGLDNDCDGVVDELAIDNTGKCELGAGASGIYGDLFYEDKDGKPAKDVVDVLDTEMMAILFAAYSDQVVGSPKNPPLKQKVGGKDVWLCRNGKYYTLEVGDKFSEHKSGKVTETTNVPDNTKLKMKTVGGTDFVCE